MSKSDQEATYRTFSEASSALRSYYKTGKATFTRYPEKTPNHITEEVIGDGWSIELIYPISEIGQIQNAIIVYKFTNQHGRSDKSVFCGSVTLFNKDLKAIFDVFQEASFVEIK